MSHDKRDPEKLGLAIQATMVRLKCGVLDAADALDQAAFQFSEPSPAIRPGVRPPGSSPQNGRTYSLESTP